MFQLGSELKVPKQESNIVGNYNCIYGKPAFRICTQKSCPHPSLCCQDETCICNESHQLCTQIRLKSLLQKLYSKVADTTEIMTKFTTLFDSIIDRISQIYDQTQKRIKRYGLRHAEIKFLQHMQENRTNSLTGKIVHNANQIADLKYDGEFWQIQLYVDRLWEELGGLFWGILYSTQDMYQIPTRVNRMNDNSGQEFFDDLIEQTKITLKSLQNKKMWDKNDFVDHHKNEIKVKVNNNEKQQQKEIYRRDYQQKEKSVKKVEEKVVQKQKQNQVDREQFRIEDLGYSDHEQDISSDEKHVDVIGRNELQKKRIVIYDNDVKQAVMSSQSQIKKQQNDRNNDGWIKTILRKVQSNEKPQPNKQQVKSEERIIKKEQNSNILIEQLRKKEWMRQKVFPPQEEEKVQLKEQLQFKNMHQPPQLMGHQQKIIEDMLVRKSESIKPLSLMQKRNSYEQSEQFIQAANYLSQIMGFNLKFARQFVFKNGYNREGKLMSQEQILDLALIKTSSQ